MLCQFTFSNFKSYRDEVTLDLCPANISEHSETLIVDKTDETNYLPIAAIYGPNGGGKSNVIEAFHFLRRTVLIPPQLDKTVLPLDGGSIDQSRAAQKKYFLFDDSGKTLPSSFEVIFRKSGREYKYILKIKEGLIVEENLYATDTDTQEVMLVFERMKDSIELSELLSGANVDKVNPTMPLIQYLTAMYDFDIIKNAVSWFIVAKTINYGNSRSEKSVIFPDTP